MININNVKEMAIKLNLRMLNSDDELLNYSQDNKVTLIDNEGYKYRLSYGNLCVIHGRNTTPNRFFRNNIYTYDNINNYLKINNIDLKLITKNPICATEKIEWVCTIHNLTFKRSWNVIKNGSIMCPTCENISYRNKRSRNIDYIKKELSNRFDVKVVSNEYINNLTKLDFICNSHKDKGIQQISWGNSLDATHICQYCLKEIMKNKLTKSHKQFEIDFKKIHGNKYTLLSEYTNSSEKITVHCNNCGEDFASRASHLLEGHGCPNCNKSKGEEKIQVYLNNNNIAHIREYRFDDCKNKKSLPFDFYLPNENILIEYQGEQHYTSVELFGGDNQLKLQNKNDNIKRNYCEKNNIKLIEIPYWDYNNIEKILKIELNGKGLI